jgi:hypothetical protein
VDRTIWTAIDITDHAAQTQPPALQGGEIEITAAEGTAVLARDYRDTAAVAVGAHPDSMSAKEKVG